MPRLPLLLAAAAFLAPPLLAGPQDPGAPVECSLKFFDPEATNFAPAPSAAVCAALESYVGPYKKLLKAADFAEDSIPLWGRIRSDDNAAFYTSAKVVMVNTGTISLHPKPDAAMLFVLAHELGHAVQERGGELAWRYASGLSEEEGKRRSRVTEGQADAIATDLLTRAGLGGARMTMKGVEDFFSCADIQNLELKGVSHPAPKDRFLQQLKQGSLAKSPHAPLDDSGLAAAFDQARKRADLADSAPKAGPRVYRPPLGLDDFDAYGRPKTQGLRTAGVPAASVAPPVPKDAPFWTKMRAAAGAAWTKAVDSAWFNNPTVETVALKSCGIAKQADFNEAVAVGSVAWMSDAASDLTKRLKRVLE